MAGKSRILVVDDEPDTRTFFVTLLEDAGYATEEAENGQDALDKVKAERPDLITLDVTMPETSGVRFYRDMKESEEYQGIPIIIITGISQDFKEFISSRRQVPPPEGFLSKPIDQKEFLGMVEGLLS
jgi:CheY-like chemotaxis protein